MTTFSQYFIPSHIRAKKNHTVMKLTINDIVFLNYGYGHFFALSIVFYVVFRYRSSG